MTPPAGGAPDAAGRRLARRIEAMDALRGLALLGILQVNIQSFTWGAGEPLGYLSSPPGTGESLLYLVQATLFEGKFYPIFGFLFGVGMALQLRKLRRLHGRDAHAVASAYRRRLLILFVLGLAHGLLFYSGDVLATYAACGLIFMACAPLRLDALRRFTAWAWALAALALFAPIAATVLLAPETPAGTLPAALTATHEIYSTAGFLAQLRQRASDEVWQQVGDIPTFWPQVLALFGLGAIAGRLGWIQAPSRHRLVWRRALLLGLGAGLPLSLAGAALSLVRARSQPGSEGGWEGVLLGLGSLLAAAYVAAALHAFEQPWGLTLRRWLAAPGRLSLSNYVGQSIVMGALFSGWGLGLGAQASRAELALAACVIFGVQLLVSRAILRRFRQGPLEALWRRATYGAAPVHPGPPH